MPEINFDISADTGEVKMRIKGIRGAGCKPLHKSVSDDLKRELGIDETHVEDTPEMRQSVTVDMPRQVRIGG